jgi:hypothetical protein
MGVQGCKAVTEAQHTRRTMPWRKADAFYTSLSSPATAIRNSVKERCYCRSASQLCVAVATAVYELERWSDCEGRYRTVARAWNEVVPDVVPPQQRPITSKPAVSQETCLTSYPGLRHSSTLCISSGAICGRQAGDLNQAVMTSTLCNVEAALVFTQRHLLPGKHRRHATSLPKIPSSPPLCSSASASRTYYASTISLPLRRSPGHHREAGRRGCIHPSVHSHAT